MNTHTKISKAVVPFALLALLVGAGCASKSSKSGASKGDGAKSASAAVKAGQKEGKNLKEHKGSAADKGHTAGGTGKQKNGGAHDPAAAQAGGEKVGSTAEGDQSKATDEGESFMGASCDADHEGTGFCGDETHVDFCHEGHWYALDCDAQESGAFCGEELTEHTVDCWKEAELVVEGDVAVCDEEAQGAAFCEDDERALFCDSGEWYELSCGDAFESGMCLEDGESLLVDCSVEGDTLEAESKTTKGAL